MKSFVQNAFKTILKYPILLIVFFIIATRLSQLISPFLLLDPDECVTALMAKHLLEGKDFSMFFWGQKYGLAIVETSVIAAF